VRVDVLFGIQQLTPHDVQGRVVAMIDVLRASTTIAVGLANGARTIIPMESSDDAVTRSKQFERASVLLAGERRMLRMDGFDLGNSPVEHTREAVEGKTVLLTTTNGTKALLAVQGARDVVVASYVNLTAVCAMLRAAIRGGADITIVCAEPDPPYNRVLLSQVLAGTVADQELALRHPDWYASRGVTLRLGVTARHVDTATRTVELADGEVLAYDELVLATGSRPFVPPVPGADLPGVHVFRTRADARAIMAAASGARRSVVIGGGLLGLEAARALREHGTHTTVVHLADTLMEQQLDAPAASLLERALRDLRVHVRTSARTEALAGDGRVESVVLEGGEELPADLVVIAAGIVPEVDLARTAGLETARGVLVDDGLRTSAPGVRAVGECAEHRGMTYGLWSPLLEQARAVGASLAGGPAAFLGSVPATTLKVAGIELFCCGRVSASERDEEVLALDSRRRRYRRLLVHDDGRLAGAILLGDLRDARALRELLRDGDEVPAALLGGLDAPPTDLGPADANVCSCQGVTRGEIVQAIRDRALTTVEQVAEHTRASTGCGGCRPDIAALLAAIREESAA